MPLSFATWKAAITKIAYNASPLGVHIRDPFKRIHWCIHAYTHSFISLPMALYVSTLQPLHQESVSLKRQLIDLHVQDHLGWTQWSSRKYLTINFLKKWKPLIVVFATFSGIDTPKMPNLKLTVLCHWRYAWWLSLVIGTRSNTSNLYPQSDQPQTGHSQLSKEDVGVRSVTEWKLQS